MRGFGAGASGTALGCSHTARRRRRGAAAQLCPIMPRWCIPVQPRTPLHSQCHRPLASEPTTRAHPAAPPELVAACGTYFDTNGALLDACAFTGDDGMLLEAPTCSFGCSKFWKNLEPSCRAYLEQNPLFQDAAGEVLPL